MKVRYFVSALFLATSAFAADRVTAVRPAQQRQPNPGVERAIPASKIVPALVAQFSSVFCTDGDEDYAPGDTVCRAHNLWECQKDGTWINLKKKC
jgi:hypothetical protein